MNWFWIFFLMLTVSAAPVRLALLGDGNAVDQVMAELSGHDEIELLERSRIAAILSEHRLNAAGLSTGVLVRHFPHIDVFAVFSPERLVVFNAKNGFRLWDGKPETPAKTIRLAVAKAMRKNPLYLSIVSVRDVGVPRRLKPELEKLTVELEQRLIQSPAIQMLERARLGAVSDERELTGKVFSLMPSARLLTLEFEPGSESHIVNVKVIVRDFGGKTLGRCTEYDAFRNLNASATSLQIKLNHLLLAREVKP